MDCKSIFRYSAIRNRLKCGYRYSDGRGLTHTHTQNINIYIIIIYVYTIIYVVAYRLTALENYNSK